MGTRVDGVTGGGGAVTIADITDAGAVGADLLAAATEPDALTVLHASRRWPATAATRLLWECDGASGALVCTGSVGSAGNLTAGGALGRNALSPYSTIGRGVRCTGTPTSVASGAAGVAPSGTATALTVWCIAELPNSPGSNQQLIARDYYAPASFGPPYVSCMLTVNGTSLVAHATIDSSYYSLTADYPLYVRQVLVGMTFDGTTLALWINGVLAASATHAGSIDWGTAPDSLWYLGRNGIGEYYTGAILRAGVEAEVWDATTWASRYETMVGATT